MIPPPRISTLRGSGSLTRRSSGRPDAESEFIRGCMTFARKLELGCGIATAVVAISLSLFVLKFDWDASLKVDYQFAVLRELGFVAILYLFLDGIFF